MADEGYKLDGPSMRRLDRHLRRRHGRVAPHSEHAGRYMETCWGRLTSPVEGEGWEWEEVTRHRATDGTLTWATVTNGRSGSNSRADPFKCLAVGMFAPADASPLLGYPAGPFDFDSVVLLRRQNTLRAADPEADPPTLATWQTNWHIVPLTGQLFPVRVTQVGGDNAADLDSAPTYTYDVNVYLVGTVIGPAMSPVWGRSNGFYFPATNGTAFWHSDGSLILWQVDEVRDTAAERAAIISEVGTTYGLT